MNIFVAGIGTGVGKTVVSAILCEALGADYWKPVQAGNLRSTDTMQVKRWVTNPKCTFHPEAYRFRLAASPHQAAATENKRIQLENIIPPTTRNHLIIEGAGGLLVPLNGKALMIDLISRYDFPVILVSRHYLGSINHTLLSIEALKSRRLKITGIIFNGNENKFTEQIILRISGVKMLGRMNAERRITRKVVCRYAKQWANRLVEPSSLEWADEHYRKR